MIMENPEIVRAIGITEKPSIGQVGTKLTQLELPRVQPRNDEVLVRVYASAINLDDRPSPEKVDTKISRGKSWYTYFGGNTHERV
jgi:hypothetical protein